MQNTHLISGAPAAFIKSFTALIADSGVALSIVSLTSSSGRLVAVVEETSQNKHARGALLEVRALTSPSPSAISDLAAENPCWSVIGAFASAATAKPAKSTSAKVDADAAAEPSEAADLEAEPNANQGLIVIAVLRQP